MKIVSTSKIKFNGIEIFSNTVITNIIQPLHVEKFVDKENAFLNDFITYTTIISNPNDCSFENVCFADIYDETGSTLPKYVNDSFICNEERIDPDSCDPIVYTIPLIDALSNVSICFQVKIRDNEPDELKDDEVLQEIELDELDNLMDPVDLVEDDESDINDEDDESDIVNDDMFDDVEISEDISEVEQIELVESDIEESKYDKSWSRTWKTSTYV